MPLYRPENVDAPVLSQFSLKGKVAAVTGGARGIGLEVVRGLAEAGASVALIYTTSSSAPETASKIAKETGSRVSVRENEHTSIIRAYYNLNPTRSPHTKLMLRTKKTSQTPSTKSLKILVS